jgi:hypothetical protein
MSAIKVVSYAILGVVCVAMVVLSLCQIGVHVTDYADTREYYVTVATCNGDSIVVNTPTCGDVDTHALSSMCKSKINNMIIIRHNPDTCSVFYDYNIIFKLLPWIGAAIAGIAGAVFAYRDLRHYSLSP